MNDVSGRYDNLTVDGGMGARYVTIAEGRPTSERFVYGWFKNRVGQ
jgi:hypothetical protein